MGITVDTATQYTDLCLLADVKADLGIGVATHDTILGRLIDEASDTIRQMCNQVFARETVTETVPGMGGTLLMVTRTPIESITSIKLNGSLVDSGSYSIEDAKAGLIYNESRWASTEQYTQYLTGSVKPGAEALDYEVKYVAGYVMPEDDSPTLPRSLQRIALDFTKGLWKLRKADPRVKNEKLGDWGATYEDLYDMIERRLKKAHWVRVV